MKTKANNNGNKVNTISRIEKSVKTDKRNEIKNEYKSISLCIRLIQKHWTGKFAKQAKENGILKENVNIGYLFDNLKDRDFRGKYFVLTDKETNKPTFVKLDKATGEYVRKESFTPLYVFNLFMRIANEHYREAVAIAKEVANQLKANRK